MQWQHRTNLYTKVHRIIEDLSLSVRSLIQANVDEEDGPNATDDLESLAASRPPADSAPCTPDQPAAARTQSRKNAKRREKRRQNVEEHGHETKKRTLSEHVQLSEPIQQGLNVESLPATDNAYSSQRLFESAESRMKSYSLQEFRDMGFQLIEIGTDGEDWRSPRPFLDCDKRIYAVYAGAPFDEGYQSAAESLYEFVETERQNTDFEPGESVHRRGMFPAINFGISQGNGKAEATRLNTGRHDGLINRLLNNPDLKRIASFADSAFALWAPRLHRYYRQTMQTLYEETHEKRNFLESIFACATMNFGPCVCAFKHRDMLNLAFGWCAITALGRFNSKLGGHLVLWETKTVVEFPAGSTFLIPSSCISHSNTAIQQGECRASFIQYTAGGVFRWVENGFKTDQALRTANKAEFQKRLDVRKGRWRVGVELYSTMDELLQPV